MSTQIFNFTEAFTAHAPFARLINVSRAAGVFCALERHAVCSIHFTSFAPFSDFPGTRSARRLSCSLSLVMHQRQARPIGPSAAADSGAAKRSGRDERRQAARRGIIFGFYRDGMRHPDAGKRYCRRRDPRPVHVFLHVFIARRRAQIFAALILLSRRLRRPMLSAHRRAMPGGYRRGKYKKGRGTKPRPFCIFCAGAVIRATRAFFLSLRRD